MDAGRNTLANPTTPSTPFFFYYREEVGAPQNCGLIITRTERWERKRRREKKKTLRRGVVVTCKEEEEEEMGQERGRSGK